MARLSQEQMIALTFDFPDGADRKSGPSSVWAPRS
jgi:hypothetical protein